MDGNADRYDGSRGPASDCTRAPSGAAGASGQIGGEGGTGTGHDEGAG